MMTRGWPGGMAGMSIKVDKYTKFRQWEKINKLFTGLGSVCIVKNFQDLGHSFSLYGPPSRQITSMSFSVVHIYDLSYIHLQLGSCDSRD